MILGVLQARASSTRLPGKVLADLHGRPMILRQIERLRRSRLLDELVVATSTEASDDPLVELLQREGIAVRRGPLADVLERFALVVDEFGPDHVVRLTADCPLADADVVDLVIARHLAEGADYTSNVLCPTFPDGLDVEAVTVDALARLRASDPSPQQREHVTLGIVQDGRAYELRSVEQEPDRSALRWTVDVPDDLEFVRAVYDHLYDTEPDFRQADILALLDARPELRRTEDDLARNAGLG